MSRLIFGTPEGWDDAYAQWTEFDQPTQDRRALRFGGAPVVRGPHSDTCPRCGKDIHTKASISFGDLPEPIPLSVLVHWGKDCKDMKSRWFRLWNRGLVWKLRCRTPYLGDQWRANKRRVRHQC